jgi:hypothetical protein
MKTTEMFALERSDLNGFLFSVVGSERNGSDISVVSMLARTGADPWREAGRLAALPKQAAKEWLAQLIANGPSSTWALPEARDIAARLIGLLPARAHKEATTKRLAALRLVEARKALTLFVLAAAGMAIVFGLMHVGTQ